MSRPTEDPLRARARKLGLWGLLSDWETLGRQDWVEPLLELEERERQRRSLERRVRNAKIGRFKPMAEFDYSWPSEIDREQIQDLFSLSWIEQTTNVVLVGPNGIGKSMIAQNLVYEAVLRGATARFVTASELLNDLASQEGSSSLHKRLRRYCNPTVLAIDEVGYLSYDHRYADLLFEVVTRRYRKLPLVITTNKVFAEWDDVFPSASCVVTLVDRLVHQAEIVTLQGDSFRLKEAREQAATKARERAARRRKKASS